MYYIESQEKLTKNGKFVIMTKREVIILDTINYKEKQQKSLRLETELIQKINRLAEKNQRDFTKQVTYMLKKYIELIEE